VTAADRIAEMIAAEPDAVDPYLVLADELLRAGDPRGELIVAQHHLLEHPDDAELAAHVKSFLAPYERELADIAQKAVPVCLPWWQLGFVRALTIHLGMNNSDTLATLLDLPSCRFVAQLNIAGDRYPTHGPDPLGVAIRAIAARPRPALRSLSLVEEYGEIEPALKGTGGLWTAAPNLRHVHLRAERALFRKIAHAHLELLTLELEPLGEERWRLELPALRVLAWDPSFEGDCDVGIFDSLWRQDLPALRELTLRGQLVAFDRLLDRPEVCDFIARLDRLTIPMQALLPHDDATTLADHLVAHASMLQHLSRLIVLNILDRSGDLDAARARLPNLEIEHR
jgi:hypothetical protein